MTPEEKSLLLKDLCARLPYKVYCDASKWTDDKPRQILEVCPFFINEVLITELAGWMSIEYCRPYLRPMSSMTEEELHEYNMHLLGITTGVDAINFMIWIYQHHLDIFHFIEKGLAIEAPKGMY